MSSIVLPNSAHAPHHSAWHRRSHPSVYAAMSSHRQRPAAYYYLCQSAQADFAANGPPGRGPPLGAQGPPLGAVSIAGPFMAVALPTSHTVGPSLRAAEYFWGRRRRRQGGYATIARAASPG